MLRNMVDKRNIFVLIFVVVCLTALAGCEGKKAAPGTNEVWIIGWNYIPDTITVPVGTTVTWNNTTLDYHTVTSDNGLFDARLDAGHSFRYTFTRAGTFGYHDGATDPPTIGKVIVR